MDWRILRQTGYIDVSGTRYDLSHLADRKYGLCIEAAKGRPELPFELLVQFSSHCVSWGAPHDGAIDFGVHGPDRRILDDKGNERCFCDRRYALSTNYLIPVFDCILERTCFFTGYENWMMIEIITEEGARLDYEIFFSLTRQTPRFLRLYVESAYVRENEDTQPKPKKRLDKVRAKTRFAKKLRGEAIRRPH